MKISLRVLLAALLTGLPLFTALGWRSFAQFGEKPKPKPTPVSKRPAAPRPAAPAGFSIPRVAWPKFVTVKLDARGRLVNKEMKRANYFTIDLGNGATLDMVEIHGGSFMMGSPETEADRYNDEGPRHRVNVPSFWMGKYEVTQKQWRTVMNNNPSYFKGNYSLPVENVSWNDAHKFLKALNRKLGL